MKKFLSVFLAALLIAMTVLPAFAAGGTYTVNFVQPSATLESADGYLPYYFVKTENGSAAYGPVTNGEYVYVRSNGKGLYTPISNVIEPEKYNFTEFYGPVVYRDDAFVGDTEHTVKLDGPDYPIGSVVTCEAGEVVSFVVLTNRVYNAASASVYVNGQVIAPMTNGEYRISIDRNTTVSVLEKDENGNEILQRNMFAVSLPSGDGYSVRPLEGQNYALVPYGGDFSFRVKITKGFTDNGMTVKAIRGSLGLEEFLGDDVDLSGVIGMLPSLDMPEGVSIAVEGLSSTGIDASGYRTYTLKNVTSESKITVSGVREESSANIFAMLKRILRLILDFFGIKIGLFDSLTNLYEVSVNSTDSDRISYAIKTGSSKEDISPSAFEIASGDSVTIEVATTYADADSHVNVNWRFVDADGNIVRVVNGADYGGSWAVKRNPNTGVIYYSKLFVIDNIDNNVIINVSEK